MNKESLFQYQIELRKNIKNKMTYILGLWVLVWIWIIYDMANTPIYPEDWIEEENTNENK